MDISHTHARLKTTEQESKLSDSESMFTRFRRKRNIKRAGIRYAEAIHSGRVYHQQTHTIVVSEKEMKLLLRDMGRQHTNLIKLMFYGNTIPYYDTLLNIVAEKYALIGSFVFPKDDVHTAKLPVESYFELFSSIEELDDVKECLSHISGKTLSDAEVKATAVKVWRFASAASQLMSRPADNFWAHRYLTLAQWILSDDSLSGFSGKDMLT